MVLNIYNMITTHNIQSDLGGKVNILEGDIGHCVLKKTVHMNMGLFLNGYRQCGAWISKSNSIRFVFVWLDEKRSLQKKSGHTRRIARSHFFTMTDTIASQNTDIFSWICTYVRIRSCQPNYFATNFGWWSSRLVDSSPMKLVLRFYCNSWLNRICIVMYPYDWEKQLVSGSDSNKTGYTVHHPCNWRQKISL